MNRYIKIIGFSAVLLAALLATAAVAFAQSASPTPVAPAGGYGQGYGPGMTLAPARGDGRMGRGGPQMGGGVLSDYEDLIHTEIARALGLSLTDFEAQLAAGQTPFALAQQRDIDPAQVAEAMQAGHAAALKQAVQDGKLTQAQADWMLSRQIRMQGFHAQAGSGMGRMGPGMAPAPARDAGVGGGRMGRGAQGGLGGACPWATPTP